MIDEPSPRTSRSGSLRGASGAPAPAWSRHPLARFLAIFFAAFLGVHGLGLFDSRDRSSGPLERLGLLFAGLEGGVGRLLTGAPAERAVEATPPVGSRGELRYRVRRGDTLSAIAARHGLTVTEIAAHNRLDDPDLISVGLALAIPTAPGPAAAALHGEADGGTGPAAPEPPPAAPAATAASPEVEAFLALAEREIREAHFEEALRTTQTIERLLAAGPREPVPPAVLTRLELLRATVWIALGDAERAQQALRRALVATPDLALDRATTAPKLLRALEAAREPS